MRRLLVIALALLWAAPAAGAAPEVPELLARIQRATAQVSTLSAQFRQEKNSSLFQAPLVSRGRLCFARPARLVWEYSEPEAAGFVHDNGRSFVWRGQRELKPVSGAEATGPSLMAENILAWLDLQPEEMLARYDIQIERQDPPLLRLTPRQGAQALFFSAMLLALSADLRQLNSLTLLEPGGESTSIDFSQVRLNAPLPPDCAP